MSQLRLNRERKNNENVENSQKMWEHTSVHLRQIALEKIRENLRCPKGRPKPYAIKQDSIAWLMTSHGEGYLRKNAAAA